MKASIFSSWPSMRPVALALSAFCLVFAACGQHEKPTVASPAQLVLPDGVDPADMNKLIFPNEKGGGPPVYPDAVHLRECGAGLPECAGGTVCLGLGGASVCLFPCSLKNGEGDVQNPDCIAPENCIQLRKGSNDGACIFFPGQLYGSGSYKSITRHKRGERCLLRYGACEERHVCVDTKNDGSIGTCEEGCQPQPKGAGSKNQPDCSTPNTTCKILASGIGACLP